jgi:hypothetical protein
LLNLLDSIDKQQELPDVDRLDRAMCGYRNICFSTRVTENMVTAAMIPALDLKLLGYANKVVDSPVARIVSHCIEQFPSLVHCPE